MNLIALFAILLTIATTGSTPAKAVTHAACAKPQALHLVRFEDGSAQLRCAQRILLRVSVPG
jgi:hypothetical protein